MKHEQEVRSPPDSTDRWIMLGKVLEIQAQKLTKNAVKVNRAYWYCCIVKPIHELHLTC